MDALIALLGLAGIAAAVALAVVLVVLGVLLPWFVYTISRDTQAILKLLRTMKHD